MTGGMCFTVVFSQIAGGGCCVFSKVLGDSLTGLVRSFSTV